MVECVVLQRGWCVERGWSRRSQVCEELRWMAVPGRRGCAYPPPSHSPVDTFPPNRTGHSQSISSQPSAEDSGQ